MHVVKMVATCRSHYPNPYMYIHKHYTQATMVTTAMIVYGTNPRVEEDGRSILRTTRKSEHGAVGKCDVTDVVSLGLLD